MAEKVFLSDRKVSFDTPEYTGNADGLGTLRFLDAIRLLGMEKKVKFYQASTSELYGKVVETPQKETTPFYPRSPYGCAKLMAHWLTVNYRESFGLFTCSDTYFLCKKFSRFQFIGSLRKNSEYVKINWESNIFIFNKRLIIEIIID